MKGLKGRAFQNSGRRGVVARRRGRLLMVHFEDVYHLLQPSQRLDSQILVSLLQTSLF
jgi:hypothetical protein